MGRPESGNELPRSSAPVSLSGFSTGPDMRIIEHHIFPAFDGRFDADGIFGVPGALVRRYLHDTAELERANSNILIQR